MFASKNTLIRELTSSLMTQQSLGTVLGVIDYSSHQNALPEALDCILEFVKPSVRSAKSLKSICS